MIKSNISSERGFLYGTAIQLNQFLWFSDGVIYLSALTLRNTGQRSQRINRHPDYLKQC